MIQKSAEQSTTGKIKINKLTILNYGMEIY